MEIKTFLVTLIMVLWAVMAGGCTPSPTPVPTPNAAPPYNPIMPDIVEKLPPSDLPWISPAKVKISNFYMGAEADYPITIHNGDLKPTKFSLTFSVPFSTSDGHLKAPKEVGDWVIISDATPVLAGRETKDIIVILKMPSAVPDNIATFYQNSSKGTAYLTKAREDTVENLELQRTLMKQQLSNYEDVSTRLEQLRDGGGLLQVLLKEFPYRGPEIGKAWQDTMTELNRRLIATPYVLSLVYFEQENSITAKRLNTELVDSAELTNLTRNSYVVTGNLKTDKWEFWIIVFPSQIGVVQTQMASRWQVVMR